jgi:hypothetical protein
LDELLLIYTTGIPQAIRTFEDHYAQPFLQELYNTQWSSLQGPELDRFVHTKDFQEWLNGGSSTVICTTSDNRDNVPCPLAACLAKYLQTRSKCCVLYVDCFWIMQSPQQTRVRTLVAEEKNELGSEFVGEDSSNIVLESLYRQLFRQCKEREAALGSYHDALSAAEAFSFRTEMLANGLPPRRHLMPLYEDLLRCCSMEILVSIDRIQELEELPRTRLVAQIALVKNGARRVKSLLCGDPDIVETGSLSGVAIVTDKTELYGKWQ